MSELISVIIPIYNVQEYLSRCIESVINQSYKNIEILLINDGSTDKSLEICQRYQEIDNRIKIINKINGGLSDARNTGLKICSGKYIAFIDADDFIDESFIKTLYDICKKNQCEIAQCSFLEVENDFLEINGSEDITIINNKQSVSRIYSSDYVSTIITCNKLYKKELFNNITFPVGRIHEDEATIYKLLYKATRIGIIDKTLYAYFLRPQSIMRQDFNIKRLDYLLALKERIDYFNGKDEELYYLSLKNYCFSLVEFYNLCKNKIENHNSICIKLKEEYVRKYITLINNRNNNLKIKLLLRLFRICPRIYPLMVHIKDKKLL